MRLRHPFRSDRGVGAVEFALAAPVFFGMVIGVSQLGTLYFANASVKHAVDEAARRATIFPTPTDATLVAALRQADFGTKGVLTPTVSRVNSSDGMPVIDITVDYRVPLNFVFYETQPVTLSYTRRVYLQEDSAGTINSGGSAPSSTTSSTGGTTTSTTSSTGGTTTTSTTSSTGGTSTTSTTSSTGGTTTTTSSTGGTTTPGNGNASSSGNGNNGTRACKKNCK